MYTVLGLMPHPENATDPLLGSTDGSAFFAGLAGRCGKIAISVVAGSHPMEISTTTEFVTSTLRIAKELGYPVARNRDGYLQIDFGHKKLHEALRRMFPDILNPGVNVSKLIDRVAPGRPCAHKPMKTIIAKMQVEART